MEQSKDCFSQARRRLIPIVRNNTVYVKLADSARLLLMDA